MNTQQAGSILYNLMLKDPVDKPGFDLILGSNTLKQLGIVLDFWTKEITLDEISLPMRDINNLNTQS